MLLICILFTKVLQQKEFHHLGVFIVDKPLPVTQERKTFLSFD